MTEVTGTQVTGTQATGNDSAGADGEARRKRMLERIYAAMEAKMLEIETGLARKRGAGCGSASAADNERDVRTLNTLTRMIEKISALTAKGGAAEGDVATDPEAEARDAERLREEIADRIARLRRSEEVQAGHG